jgi:hypothetical protein
MKRSVMKRPSAPFHLSPLWPNYSPHQTSLCNTCVYFIPSRLEAQFHTRAKEHETILLFAVVVER